MMGNGQEYIEIYDLNRELIDRPCAKLLNDEREKAAERFKAQGFPGIKEEEWLHTNVTKRFIAADYGMNL